MCSKLRACPRGGRRQRTLAIVLTELETRTHAHHHVWVEERHRKERQHRSMLRTSKQDRLGIVQSSPVLYCSRSTPASCRTAKTEKHRRRSSSKRFHIVSRSGCRGRQLACMRMPPTPEKESAASKRAKSQFSLNLSTPPPPPDRASPPRSCSTPKFDRRVEFGSAPIWDYAKKATKN